MGSGFMVQCLGLRVSGLKRWALGLRDLTPIRLQSVVFRDIVPGKENIT